MTARRVLVVDDDNDIREVAALALDVVGGWDVISAESGTDALALAQVEHPDAILLDVMMPGMDGPTTVTRLRELPEVADIPVIFLTAKTLQIDRQDWARLELAGIIAKPFDPMTLAAEVSRLLGWSR
jgi:CheY-like chemotaxis protein